MNRYKEILERLEELKKNVEESTDRYSYGVIVGLTMAEAVVRETEDSNE